MTHEVSEAREVDRGGEVVMLARAFADDPAMRFIFPDSTVRARRMPRLFSLLYTADGPVGMRLMTAGGEAATWWRHPGHQQIGMLHNSCSPLPMLPAPGGPVGRGTRTAGAAQGPKPAR